MLKYAKSGITGEPTGPKPGTIARWLTCLFGTGLGTGYAPIAQGTFGSALFVLLWWLFVPASLSWEIGVMLAMHVISVPLSLWGERMWGNDPGRITIDEFAGQAIALLAVPRDPLSLGLAFLLFRIFDAFKLPWVRRHVETLPGGWGVTLDDTVAGILARLVLIPLLIGMRQLAG